MVQGHEVTEHVLGHQGLTVICWLTLSHAVLILRKGYTMNENAEKEVFRLLEALEIQATCAGCGHLSLLVLGGGSCCPHCNGNPEYGKDIGPFPFSVRSSPDYNPLT